MSNLETAPAHKFLDQGIIRDFLPCRGKEIAQEFNQPLCRHILRHRVIYAEQLRFGVLLQHVQLIQRSGVKDRIRILLEGENIFFLALRHCVPRFNRAARVPAAELVIPNNAADETAVRCGNAVMVVNIQLCQRADKDFEFIFIRNLRCQPVVWCSGHGCPPSPESPLRPAANNRRYIRVFRLRNYNTAVQSVRRQ